MFNEGTSSDHNVKTWHFHQPRWEYKVICGGSYNCQICFPNFLWFFFFSSITRPLLWLMNRDDSYHLGGTNKLIILVSRGFEDNLDILFFLFYGAKCQPHGALQLCEALHQQWPNWNLILSLLHSRKPIHRFGDSWMEGSRVYQTSHPFSRLPGNIR